METAFSRDVERSVSTYFHAFGPSPDWDELVWWPPDVFALGSLVLDHAEAYRFVVAPPRGRRWPPLADWGEQVCAAADDWRGNVSPRGCEPPALVRRCWNTISRDRNVPLASFRSGEAWDAIAALLTLTSYGMAARSRPPGVRPSRVVAHWISQSDGAHEIELAPGAEAVLLTTAIEASTLWTADGRCHRDVPRLRLSGVASIRPVKRRSRARPRRRRSPVTAGLRAGGGRERES